MVLARYKSRIQLGGRYRMLHGPTDKPALIDGRPDTTYEQVSDKPSIKINKICHGICIYRVLSSAVAGPYCTTPGPWSWFIDPDGQGDKRWLTRYSVGGGEEAETMHGRDSGQVLYGFLGEVKWRLFRFSLIGYLRVLLLKNGHERFNYHDVILRRTRTLFKSTQKHIEQSSCCLSRLLIGSG